MKKYHLFIPLLLFAVACGHKKFDSTPPTSPVPLLGTTVHDTTSNTYGGSGDDGFVSTIAMTDGGFLSAGYTSSNDGQVSGNHGGYDIWVVRTNSSGAIVWQKCYGGSGNDRPTQMIATPDNNFAIIGTSLSVDGDRKHNDGPMWIVKIDGSGNILWEQGHKLGVPGLTPAGIATAVDGSLLFLGNDNGQSTNGGVIFKTDQQGNLITGYSFASTDSWYFSSIKPVSNGYMLAGSSVDTLGQLSPNHGGGDLMLFKLSLDGKTSSKHVYGGTAADTAYAIVQTSDNGFLVAGSTVSHDGDIKKNEGNSEWFICRVDTGGVLKWANTYGGKGKEAVSFISPTVDGNYLLSGYTSSNDGNLAGNHGLNDILVVKMDLNGQVLSQRICGGSGDERPGQVIESAAGKYAAVGSTSSKDGDVIGSHGGPDAWLFRF